MDRRRRDVNTQPDACQAALAFDSCTNPGGVRDSYLLQRPGQDEGVARSPAVRSNSKRPLGFQIMRLRVLIDDLGDVEARFTRAKTRDEPDTGIAFDFSPVTVHRPLWDRLISWRSNPAGGEFGVGRVRPGRKWNGAYAANSINRFANRGPLPSSSCLKNANACRQSCSWTCFIQVFSFAAL
jgi:hypothetical protein